MAKPLLLKGVPRQVWEIKRPGRYCQDCQREVDDFMEECVCGCRDFTSIKDSGYCENCGEDIKDCKCKNSKKR